MQNAINIPVCGKQQPVTFVTPKGSHHLLYLKTFLKGNTPNTLTRKEQTTTYFGGNTILEVYLYFYCSNC